MANSTGDAYSRTKRVALPRATLCAVFFSFHDAKKKKQKEKKVGRTCLPNGCTALPYPSAAGLEEECWKSQERKSASPSVPSGGGGAPGTTDQKLMAWSYTPDPAVQRWAGEPPESRRTIRSSFGALIF